jgi:putative flavoprotein involved in K+ transport
MEVSKSHRTWLAGNINGHVPFRIEGAAARIILTKLVLRGIFHRILTVDTPIGRRARPNVLAHGGPLVRIKPKDLANAGVKRLPRAVSADGSRIRFEDGYEHSFTNIIWCTGFTCGFDWIKLPIMGEHEPKHRKGIVDSVPGLYFVGLEFLYALSSSTLHGVGRDADRIAGAVAARVASARAAEPRRAELRPATNG